MLTKSRLVRAVLALVFLLPGAQAARAASGFTDVPPSAMFYREITWLADQGIATGWPDGTFRPTTPVNRDAMAAFLYRLSGSPAFTPPATSPFRDVGPGDAFYTEITWLAERGITRGWPDGTFRPTTPVNRDAMAAFLYRLSGSPAQTPPAASGFVDIAPGSPFYAEISWLTDNRITTGWPDGTYRPVAPVNRDAMAAFLFRLENPAERPAANVYAPGTHVSQYAARQVVVADHTAANYGTTSWYQWTGSAWARVDSVSSSFGYNGVKPASTRVEGDGATPLGTYRLIHAFGQANPGTAMGYRTITNCSWWISQGDQPDYNRWRESCTNPGREPSEHLMDYVTSSIGQYRQAVATSYNYDNPIRPPLPGSGSAIFVHYQQTGRSTAGCVGLNDLAKLTSLVRWLDPAANPLIVITT